MVNCKCEDRNPQDPYTVCLRKDGTMIRIYTLFLRCGGVTDSNMTAPQLISHSHTLSSLRRVLTSMRDYKQQLQITYRSVEAVANLMVSLPDSTRPFHL